MKAVICCLLGAACYVSAYHVDKHPYPPTSWAVISSCIWLLYGVLSAAGRGAAGAPQCVRVQQNCSRCDGGKPLHAPALTCFGHANGCCALVLHAGLNTQQRISMMRSVLWGVACSCLFLGFLAHDPDFKSWGELAASTVAATTVVQGVCSSCDQAPAAMDLPQHMFGL